MNNFPLTLSSAFQHYHAVLFFLPLPGSELICRAPSYSPLPVTRTAFNCQPFYPYVHDNIFACQTFSHLGKKVK